jgi:DNA-binding transcriptional MerR regulator
LLKRADFDSYEGYNEVKIFYGNYYNYLDQISGRLRLTVNCNTVTILAMKTQEWTLHQLAAEAALVLARDGVGQPSGRVTEVPSPRTIRFYTTSGLLDPPSRYQGRTALYGSHHLWQLVVVKKLQAHGYSLEEIRQALPGLEEAGLRRLVRVPKDGQKVAPPRRRRDDDDSTAQANPRSRRALVAARPSQTIKGIRVDPQLMLLLEDVDRPILPADLEAIQVAAAPLLKLLHIRLFDNTRE